ncbi:MAG: TlpA family protein disulfide reductase [Candidatus Marinimicrobia bacterium]|nr:TlpA family protein disulfide reductase [Candidatus Neomarinimicrobiota bacterium]
MQTTSSRIFMLIALAATTVHSQETAEPVTHNIVQAGEMAPTFFLRQSTGKSFFMTKIVGPKAKEGTRKPIVLSYFATWCIPCKKEIPQLEILQQKYPGVGIYLIDVNEPPDLLAAYIKEYDIKLDVLMDRYGKVAAKYGVVNEQGVGNLPTLFIIDEDGTVILSHVGYKEGDEKEYDEILHGLTTP